MGMESIVYGRIEVNYKNSLADVQTLIRSLNDDALIKTDMFGLGSSSYYDNPIITFGASYKSIEYRWNDFMLEFEHFLKKISFVTARIKLETEVEGTFDFFWVSRCLKDDYERSEKLIPTKDWHFGYGNRNRWGFLLNSNDDKPIFNHENFTYPLKS